MTSVAVRTATPRDRASIEALLRDAALPLDGIDDVELVVAEDDGHVVGCAGIEVRGRAALLRSVVVARELRGHGAGELLVRAVLDSATQRGLAPVVLLTTTASAWFPRFGFAPIARDSVPVSLLESAEFKGACPDTAVIMQRG